MSNNDILKKYVVQLEYKIDNFESTGSGVIVNLDNDYFYILTAKHTFFEDGIENINMDERTIFKDKIEVFDFKKSITQIKVSEIIGIDKKYDFLILVISKKSFPKIENIKSLAIYEDDFKNCKICGFPSSKKEDKNQSILFDCSYSMRDEVHNTYEVKSNVLLTIDGENLNANKEISGLSGSGIFVESAIGKLYLAGIQIQTASHNSLVCLDIRILAREINEVLKEKNKECIAIDGYVLKDELGINTDELDFSSMLNKLKDEKFDKQKLKEKSYKELLDIFNADIKQSLEQDSKELAKRYLYLSLLFHKAEDNRRSTIYFKKAVKSNPSYYALFLKAKDERRLTDKQKEKYDEINIEVSNSDVSADDLFLEMLEDKLKTFEEFDEKEGVYIQMIKLLETQLRELDKSEEIEEKKEEIFKKTIELFKLYMKEDKLDDADNILLKLKDKKHDVEYYIYELYIKEEFVDKSSSSKQELSKRYLDLLNNFKDDEEKFERLREKLDLLYNDKTDNVVSELHSVKKKIKGYEEQVNNLVDIFTKYVKDEKVLNKVNDVTKEIKNSHLKLDSIKYIIKKNHDDLIDILIGEVTKTNKELAIRVQKIYNKNIKINKKIEEVVATTTEDIKEEVKSSLSPKEVERIIKNCNYTLYKGIKKLYEDNTDSEKNYLFKKAISLAEKRHQEHLVSLKKSLEEKDKQIIEYKNEIAKLGNEIIGLELNYKQSVKTSDIKENEIRELKERYLKLEESINDSKNNQFSEAEKIIYENEILDLKKSVEQLKGQNKQIEDLKESINKSHTTSENLIDLQTKYKEELTRYLADITTKYTNICKYDNPTNIFGEHLIRIEDKLNDLTNYISANLLDKTDMNEIIGELTKMEEILTEIEEYSSKELRPSINRSLRVSENLKGINFSYKQNIKEYKKEIEELLKEVHEKVNIKNPEKLLVKHLKKVEKEWSKIDEKDSNLHDSLFVIYSKLQQIKDYVPKKKSKFYLFNIIHSIIVFVLVIFSLVVLFLNIGF